MTVLTWQKSTITENILQGYNESIMTRGRVSGISQTPCLNFMITMFFFNYGYHAISTNTQILE